MRLIGKACILNVVPELRSEITRRNNLNINILFSGRYQITRRNHQTRRPSRWEKFSTLRILITSMILETLCGLLRQLPTIFPTRSTYRVRKPSMYTLLGHGQILMSDNVGKIVGNCQKIFGIFSKFLRITTVERNTKLE